MKRIYVQRYAVEGTLFFPLDMLRYDKCYPRRPEDAGAIERSIDIVPGTDPKEIHRVHLERRVLSPSDLPNVARWASFQWTAVPDTITTEEIE